MKYQLKCPKCGEEFACDDAKYDAKIKLLGAEIKKIAGWFSYYKTLSPKERSALAGKRREQVVALSHKQKELAELKAIRQYVHRATDTGQFEIFKDLVYHKLGKEEYMKLIEQMQKESAAYKPSDMMKHEYTRSGGVSIVSLGKL